MKHPVTLILPILLLADYFLTVWGAILKEKKYDQFFKTDHYELNPTWQRSIAQKRWFNPRHLVLAALSSGAMIYLSELPRCPKDLIDGLVACFIVLYGATIGRHLTNILIFRRLIKKSDDISGQITMSHDFALAFSRDHCVTTVVPLTLLAIFYPSPVVAGAFIGSLLFLANHLLWIGMYKQKGKRPAPPDDAKDSAAEARN